MVSSLKGKREILVEEYRKLGMPTSNETFDAEFETETNELAVANVGASRREDRGLDGYTERVYKRRSK